MVEALPKNNTGKVLKTGTARSCSRRAASCYACAMTPSQIVQFLDQHVVGQDEAKRQLAVAVYTHYKKVALAGPTGNEIIKSNVLLVGPTGTGKTLMCETLSRVLKVPFVTANATSLAQTEYVNDEIEAILQRLIDKAEGDIGRAQRGIVFIDEIDKLKVVHSQQGQMRGTSGEGVQHALLKIMEGAPVKIKDAHYIDTTQILFICGGAFVGLEEVLARTKSYGFISTSEADNQKLLDRLNSPRQADRPVRVRPDPGIRRAPAHRRLPEAAVARTDGAHHDRAEELDLQPVPADPAELRRGTADRAAGVRPDRRPRHGIQGRRAQPARDLRGNADAGDLPGARPSGSTPGPHRLAVRQPEVHRQRGRRPGTCAPSSCSPDSWAH
jgi:hypothetical protein